MMAKAVGVIFMFYTIKAHIHQGEQTGFVAECVELPIVTQGQTLDEVTENLREAISLHLEGEDLAKLGFAPNPPIVINYEMAAVCQN
ncbi:type II toxin-antitoxin system HicB family antitoxin [Methylocucumis oryzae]|nr:type II toxin-antitoxin system HicB family antitoxin [Methylocucumis oryzae]